MGETVSEDFGGATKAALANLPTVGEIGRVISLAEVKNLAPKQGLKWRDSGIRSPEHARTSTRSGSGFFISDDGRVLTSAHVIVKCDDIAVLHGNERAPAFPLFTDETSDIALLATPLTQPGIAKFSHRDAQIGEDILVAGFPLRPLLASNINVTMGNVSATSGPMNDSQLLQFTAPIQPGNSGGPILNEHGEVVGVVRAKLDDLAMLEASGAIPQNVNFGVKARVAVLALASHGVMLSPSASSRKMDRTALVALAREFTVIVECA